MEVNPYKCTLGEKVSREKRLLAAENCERTTGRRIVELSQYFGSIRKQLKCARCGEKTGWGCLGCGVPLCMRTKTSIRNRSPVSCMDVCHVRWKYDLETCAVMK